jgi:hypothetical protein
LLSSEDLARLVAVGVTTAEQLVEISRIIERHVMSRDMSHDVPGTDGTLSRDSVRDRERNRKRAYREKIKKHKASAALGGVESPHGLSREMSHDVPGTDGTLSHFVPQVSPTPPSTSGKKKGVLKKKEGKGTVIVPARGTRLPEPFLPDGTAGRVAAELGMDDDQKRAALDDFIDYWKGVPGARGVKLDWQATFRNSLRHWASKHMRKNGHATHRPSNIEVAQRFTAKLEEKLRAREDALRRGDGDEAHDILP